MERVFCFRSNGTEQNEKRHLFLTLTVQLYIEKHYLCPCVHGIHIINLTGPMQTVC